VVWLLKLAYLANIFAKLNKTCVSLQGKQLSVFQAQDKMLSFSWKLRFWSSDVQKKTFRCFPLSEFMEEYGENLPNMIASDIQRHLDWIVNWVRSQFAVQEYLLRTESV